jgi:hypothetical protein
MIHPRTNVYAPEHEPVDRRRPFLRIVPAGSDEHARVGSFATGLASAEPRPWDGMQMVGARGCRSYGADADERPTFGSFATGLAGLEPRPWDGRQIVAAGRSGVSPAYPLRSSAA